MIMTPESRVRGALPLTGGCRGERPFGRVSAAASAVAQWADVERAAGALRAATP
jgi:hypothetical protein